MNVIYFEKVKTLFIYEILHTKSKRYTKHYSEFYTVRAYYKLYKFYWEINMTRTLKLVLYGIFKLSIPTYRENYNIYLSGCISSMSQPTH